MSLSHQAGSGDCHRKASTSRPKEAQPTLSPLPQLENGGRGLPTDRCAVKGLGGRLARSQACHLMAQ